MRPLKWKCTKECRLLTKHEIDIVLGTKVLFQQCTEDVQAGLDNLDSGCGYVHHDSTVQSDLRFSEWRGHPISCEFPNMLQSTEGNKGSCTSLSCAKGIPLETLLCQQKTRGH